MNRKNVDIVKDIRTQLFFNMTKKENEGLKEKLGKSVYIRPKPKNYVFNALCVG